MIEKDVFIKFEPKKDGKRWKISGYVKNKVLSNDLKSIELIDLISNILNKTGDSFNFKVEIKKIVNDRGRR